MVAKSIAKMYTNIHKPTDYRNRTYRFMSRRGLSSNALVCSIIDSDLKSVSRIRLHWMNMLYVHFNGG